MKGIDEAGRIPRLCAVLARVTASLDPEAVLVEVVEDAGARCGSIATIDGTGAPREFVTSRLSTEEVERLTTCQPDGLKLFEYLRDQEAPLRVKDFPAHIRSLGLSPELALCRTFQGTPMHYRGAHPGNFYFGDKEGGEDNRERAGAPRGAMCARGLGSPSEDLAGGRGGVRRADRRTCDHQSRGPGDDTCRSAAGPARSAGHLHLGLQARGNHHARA